MGLAVEFDGALMQFLPRQIDKNHPVSKKLLARVFFSEAFSGPLLMERLVPPFFSASRDGRKADGGVVGKHIFKHIGFRADDFQVGPGSAVIQQGISEGKIQQFSLPAFQSSRWRLRQVRRRVSGVVIRQICRRLFQRLLDHFERGFVPGRGLFPLQA